MRQRKPRDRGKCAEHEGVQVNHIFKQLKITFREIRELKFEYDKDILSVPQVKSL